MEKQSYLISVELPARYGCFLPRLETVRLANIIRDAVAARSWTFKESVPFRITVQADGEAISVSGEVPRHVLA